MPDVLILTPRRDTVILPMRQAVPTEHVGVCSENLAAHRGTRGFEWPPEIVDGPQAHLGGATHRIAAHGSLALYELARHAFYGALDVWRFQDVLAFCERGGA